MLLLGFALEFKTWETIYQKDPETKELTSFLPPALTLSYPFIKDLAGFSPQSENFERQGQPGAWIFGCKEPKKKVPTLMTLSIFPLVILYTACSNAFLSVLISITLTYQLIKIIEKVSFLENVRNKYFH